MAGGVGGGVSEGGVRVMVVAGCGVAAVGVGGGRMGMGGVECGSEEAID